MQHLSENVLYRIDQGTTLTLKIDLATIFSDGRICRTGVIKVPELIGADLGAKMSLTITTAGLTEGLESTSGKVEIDGVLYSIALDKEGKGEVVGAEGVNVSTVDSDIHGPFDEEIEPEVYVTDTTEEVDHKVTKELKKPAKKATGKRATKKK